MNILVCARSIHDASNLVRMMVPAALRVNGDKFETAHATYQCAMHYDPLAGMRFDRAVVVMNPERGQKMEDWISGVVAFRMAEGAEMTVLL